MGKKSRNKEAEFIDLSEEQKASLIVRLESGKLSSQDRALLIKVLNGMAWLPRLAEHRKLSVHRLRKLFGFKTERRSKSEDGNDNKAAKRDDDDSHDPPPSPSTGSDPESNKGQNGSRPKKGHGQRIGRLSSRGDDSS